MIKYAHLSDVDLLGRLVGIRESRRLYRGALQPLFATPSETNAIHEKCAVARELVLRSLREELNSRDALTSPSAVRDYLRLTLGGREHEVFMVLFLDAQHRVLEAEELFRGTLTQTSVYPREVVKAALRANAAAVIFAHNHPSGVAQPSQADELLTRSLKEALSLVDVKVLDHFIVAGTSTLSFAERGLL
ncbi:MAG: DNA repair protein RadC [Betaproteobacteria bacterium]|nr:DNA repair protein RadC [Betaproteobacteria bacterium]